jgi:hypothetical protein
MLLDIPGVPNLALEIQTERFSSRVVSLDDQPLRQLANAFSAHHDCICIHRLSATLKYRAVG